MFPFTKELMQTIDKYYKPITPTCTKCTTQSVWMDWGPIVGKGYYCKVCRDDVDHDNNVYGSIASSKRKLTLASRPFLTDDDFEYIPLNCTKINCTNCIGKPNTQHIPVAISNFIKCSNNTGVPKSLQLNARYKVVNVAPGSVTVQVGSAQKEYSRCRFQLEIKKVKSA